MNMFKTDGEHVQAVVRYMCGGPIRGLVVVYPARKLILYILVIKSPCMLMTANSKETGAYIIIL